MSFDSKEFPHLNDTQFPNLQNVDVYAYQNNFDYARWTDGTTINLCNVLWNSDYSNVVKFENNAIRDDYFDKLNSRTVELKTAFHVAPDNTVKVPIPYQDAALYNYLYVDLPIMTSEDNPINYESNNRVQRFYYFVEDVVQLAPSSTTLVVMLDAWTTYINNVDIPYMMLERGHAPMQVTDVETYLADPLNNNRYLLAPDFDFGKSEDVVKNSEFVPFNNGEKYILIATTLSADQLKAIKKPSVIESVNTKAICEDDYETYPRNGKQMAVHHYDWGMGDYDYQNVSLDSIPYQSTNDAIPNNTCVIAVKSTEAETLFSNLSEYVPYVFKTIKACFMVDSSMFTKGSSFTFIEVNCFFVKPAKDSIVGSIKLTKDKFNFDKKYENITKLYTFPYSRIEVTDNNGEVKTFKIENTTDVNIYQSVSVAFPYISIQAFLTGVNGEGSTTYKWAKLNGTEDAKEMYSDDFGNYLWKWEIPTYALYVKGWDTYKADNYANQYAKRYDAIAEYHKTVRMANCQWLNVIGSGKTYIDLSKDVGWEGTAPNTETMTKNSADTEYSNAKNAAETSYNNAIRSAKNAQTVAQVSATANNNNAIASANALVTNTGTQTAAATTVQNRSSNANVYITKELNNPLKQALQAWDAGLTRVATDIENKNTAAAATSNAISTGAAAIASAVTNPAAAIPTLAAGAASVVGSGVACMYTQSNNTALAEATVSNSQHKVTETMKNDSNVVNKIDGDTGVARSNVATQNRAANTISSLNAATQKANSNRINGEKGSVYTNAASTYKASSTNADKSKELTEKNAKATYDNTYKNAKLNKNVAVFNATETNWATIRNAQMALEQRRIENQQDYYSNKIAGPTQHAQYSGDMTLDAMERRGLQVKIRTEREGDIAQAGDLMLRYGYALNQVWNVNESGLNLMKHYTYWKSADIWINEGEGVNQSAQRDIKAAFMNGVTVWRDPDEVGKVSIYDN